MHAVKRLAMAGGGSDSELAQDSEQLIEQSKIRLRERFEQLAAGDKLFNSMFCIGSLLGVGSFGMVMQAKTRLDITARRLRHAQDAKCAAEPSLRLQRRRKFQSQPDAVLLQCGQLVAVKFEYNIDQRRRKFQLVKEHDLLVELFNCYESKLEGFPEPFLFGCLGSSTFVDSRAAGFARVSPVFHSHHFLVMEMLGENLRTRFDKLPLKEPGITTFPVEFAFDVAKQLLTRLMFLHTAPISATHNDLKLDQLMLGSGEKKHILYLVDFGLSLKYKQGVRSRWGNRRYASRFRLQGVNTPLTDLESAAYVVARFLHNDFPWDCLQCSESAKKQKMTGIKNLLWSFVDRMRRGSCVRNDQPWQRLFFVDRTDSGGRGGPELLKYMSRLSQYIRKDPSLPSEAIDYNCLFNCFSLGAGS